MTSSISRSSDVPLVAVIGGTGMNQWPGLVIEQRHVIDTPYGAVSSPLLEGQVYGTRAIFLARHGEGHKIPPHAINYRANLWALKQAGVRSVIAIAAVGGTLIARSGGGGDDGALIGGKVDLGDGGVEAEVDAEFL